MNPAQAERLVHERFLAAGVELVEVETRRFPDESIIVATVARGTIAQAAEIGNQLDIELQRRGFRGFVTVREAAMSTADTPPPSTKGVTSENAAHLISLLTERARTSLIQPSLSYITDTAANLAKILTSRHHLVFGRRGAGKTSLLLEARRILEEQGHLAVWLNLQTYRDSNANSAFLWTIRSFSQAIDYFFLTHASKSKVLAYNATLNTKVTELLSADAVTDTELHRLIPEVQLLIQRAVATLDRRVYFFLDDFHYLSKTEQPLLLDMLHGCVRDSDAWIKVATIRHLSRWFKRNPPAGLQLGHDAEQIDLDLTLQNPTRAKEFLEEVLRRHALEAGVGSLSTVISPAALDRLLLASGAVPRDYLVLCASAMGAARAREGARTVGQQDVTRAAGVAAQAKINELEDDAAANEGEAKTIVDALQKIRSFCLDDRKFTFFRIDFKDRESHPNQYGVLQSLMDSRLVHLVSPSVSDEHRAGEKSEAYMLDLSQFSGLRMKKKLKVLDFASGNLRLVETGKPDSERIGATPKRLVAILRRGPLFSLGELTPPTVRKARGKSNKPKKPKAN